MSCEYTRNSGSPSMPSAPYGQRMSRWQEGANDARKGVYIPPWLPAMYVDWPWHERISYANGYQWAKAQMAKETAVR